MKNTKLPSPFLLVMVTGIAMFSILTFGVGPEFIKSRLQQWNICEPGQIGDVFGGTVGPLISWLAVILTFAAFWVQYTANEQQKKDLNDQKKELNDQKETTNLINFENRIFELIKLHRDNVHELKYIKLDADRELEYFNRGVMKAIFYEFIECYREVKKFSNSDDPLDYINKKYLIRLERIKKEKGLRANVIEMAIIDISYSIVFFGIETEGESILRSRFEKRYNNTYYFRLLAYIKLKPNKARLDYKHWSKLREMHLKDLRTVVDEVYENRRNNNSVSNSLSQLAIDLMQNISTEKYYSGHQDRLGHYFRHLYQSFNFLDGVDFVKSKKKYFYGKTLRAQLSTYEQALLFINSISSLGMKWEYTFIPNNKNAEDRNKQGLITTYNLIKNLPGKHLFGITYKDYYPKITYEGTDDNVRERAI